MKPMVLNMLSIRMPDMDAYYEVIFPLMHGGGWQEINELVPLGVFAYESTYDYVGDGLLCINAYLNWPE